MIKSSWSSFDTRKCDYSVMRNPCKKWIPPKKGLKIGWAKFERWPTMVVGSFIKHECNAVQYAMSPLLDYLYKNGYDLSTLKLTVEKLETKNE